MDELTIHLTAMAHGGSALGRIPASGRVVFVPLAIPGERARVQPQEGKSHYTHARLLEVLHPSPHRTEPRCTHFGVCGGCHFQHIAYPAQLAFKQQVVVDQLQRVGKFAAPPVAETLPSPAEWGYRNRASLSPTGDNQLGFWSPVEERVIPIDECHIIHPALLDLYHDLDFELPGLLRLTLRVGADGDLLVLFETQDVEPPALEADFPVSAAMLLPTGEGVNLIGDNVLIERCAGRDWLVSAGSFFQVNPGAAEHLVRLVDEFAALTGRESVLELYGGVGLFTAALASKATQVVGIEANPDAVADAAVNLEETENVTLFEGLVEEVLPALMTPTPPGPALDHSYDLVVLDPPRGGLQPAAIDALLSIRAPRIVYVSCDPATFARDARRLARGGYGLKRVQPVDMFPQTFHIETVSLLER